MKIKNIIQIILEMKGKMPESSRFLLAQKFAEQARKDLTESDKEGKFKEWIEKGLQDFFNQCEFRSGPPWVHHDISVHDTDLAAFINRWMNVDQFKRPGEKEYVPFTPDMNSVRVKMVEELKGLATAQERMNHGNQN